MEVVAVGRLSEQDTVDEATTLQTARVLRDIDSGGSSVAFSLAERKEKIAHERPKMQSREAKRTNEVC